MFNKIQAFLFAYSMREKTHAHRKFLDDIPEDVKQRRLREMIEVFHQNQEIISKEEVGRFHIVLIEGDAKYQGQLKGRTDTNKRVVVPNLPILCMNKEDIERRSREYLLDHLRNKKNDTIQTIIPLNGSSTNTTELDTYQIPKPGDYIIASVESVSKKSLFCKPLMLTSISEFSKLSDNKPWII